MIPNPREQDQVIMDIFFSQDLGSNNIKILNRCRGAMKAIFLSDLSTADGRYLKHFVFDPGLATAGSSYEFSREKPIRDNWDTWVNFWHNYTTTGGKLTMPLENWWNKTHRIWQWYYTKEDNNLQQIKGGRVVHFEPARGFRLTRSTVTYQGVWDKQHNNQPPLGCPTSVRAISLTKVTKLQDGPSLVDASQ
jgi:hypothetical protein